MKHCIALFNEGWADWEAGPILASLREFMQWHVSIATLNGAEATSIGGIRAAADLKVDAIDLKKTDLLLVIGSVQWFDNDYSNVSNLISNAVKTNVPVGAICGATIAAARAGILNDRKHTGNALSELLGKAPRYIGASHYCDVPYAVSDKGVVTACGNAPMTFAAEVIRLVDNEKGHALANEYLKFMRMEHGITSPT